MSKLVGEQLTEEFDEKNENREKKKIAFVVQRYGKEVNGGAEYHCRVLAEHLKDYYQVEVLTSCAKKYTPWDNFYNAGVEEINGVSVHRFPVEHIRDVKRFRELSVKIKKGDKSVEKEWIRELGPCCPRLISYLKENGEQYAVIIFFTYAYYLTVEGLNLGLKNTILLPTAHDEPGIYLSIYKDLFKKPNAILYNSIEERDFLVKKFGTEGIKSRLTCVGIDIPEGKYKLPKALEEYKNNYIIYVGRVSKGKNYKELNRDFIEYKRRNPSDLKMIVIGKIDGGMKLINSEDIIYTGFVTEEELLEFLKEKPEELEVVMTGREPKESLCKMADYITEMKMIKHPYEQGIPARKAIEF